jgi:ribosomal protein S12 methylthiotransferase accessory factor
MNPERSNVSDQLKKLLQPCSAGLFDSASMSYSGPEVCAGAVLCSPKLGNLSAVWPNADWHGTNVVLRAGGVGLSAEEALVPALAEGLERYSSGLCRDEQFVYASADELGRDALDFDGIPRCSKRELSHLRCPLTLPDKGKPIRWLRGLSLMDGRMTYIPAIMVYSHIVNVQVSERFWLPISTGCAAHTSYEDALLSGIYEVVERDAISITWLQKLRLPRIDIDVLPPDLIGCWEAHVASSGDVQTYFFDATLDLGVPTVYGVQVAPFNNHATTLVSCSSKSSIAKALAKVILDMAQLSAAFRQGRPLPECWDDFSEPMQGAGYMAHCERRHAFDFLLLSPATRKLSDIMQTEPHDDPLKRILKTLRSNALSCYAVDLSPDEAVRSGIRVVRIIIPGLQPLSFRYRAKFLGHPRLYDAPRRMGFPSLPEQELNDFPQPFA